MLQSVNAKKSHIDQIFTDRDPNQVIPKPRKPFVI